MTAAPDTVDRQPSRVDRLLLRCVAPADREQAALETRQRLDAVARAHLPELLTRVLEAEAGAPGGGQRRVFLEQVACRLDFAPGDYDDVTVGILWAARVRRAVEQTLRGGGGIRVFSDEAAWLRAGLEELVASSRLSWIFAELPCGSGWVLPLDFLAACDTPGRRRAVVDALAGDQRLSALLYDRLMAHERHAFLLVLEGRRPWGQWRQVGAGPATARKRWRGPGRADPAMERRITGQGRPGAAPPAAGTPSPAAGRGHNDRPGETRGHADGSADQPVAPADGARPRSRSDHGSAPTTRGPTLHEWQRALRRAQTRPERFTTQPPSSPAPGRRGAGPPAVHARGATTAARGQMPSPADASGPDQDPGWRTRAGGLVFTHPWLGAYLEAASIGVEHPVDSRRRALADLLDPADEALGEDPLVRLLAGEDPAVTPAAALPPPREDAADAATAVLRAFAALLPGFEDSSEAFLRSQFLRREGRLRRVDAETIAVVLEPGPADLVLGRLPYPVELFRLAWSPLFRVEGGGRAR